MKMVPLMDDGDDIAMVLSPQCFHNVHHQADIFNHTNIHFWEYMQIGYDALSFISCTGLSPNSIPSPSFLPPSPRVSLARSLPVMPTCDAPNWVWIRL